MSRDAVKPLLDSADLPRMRGLYRRVLVELSTNGTSGTVIARCAGPQCGGATARIPVSHWKAAECRESCRRCASAERQEKTMGRRHETRKAKAIHRRTESIIARVMRMAHTPNLKNETPEVAAKRLAKDGRALNKQGKITDAELGILLAHVRPWLKPGQVDADKTSEAEVTGEAAQ
jgi:hypothetical protein